MMAQEVGKRCPKCGFKIRRSVERHNKGSHHASKGKIESRDPPAEAVGD
jgi:uncharacterized C2H2 Zn-finger protein